jgi:hypothetical protein
MIDGTSESEFMFDLVICDCPWWYYDALHQEQVEKIFAVTSKKHWDWES